MLKFSEIQELKKSLIEQWKPNNEICGVITKEGKIEQRENQAEDPTNQFEFLEQDLEGVLGTWHTHPVTPSNLSIPDYYFFLSRANLVHFIVSYDHVSCYISWNNHLVSIDEAHDLPPWLSEGHPSRTD